NLARGAYIKFPLNPFETETMKLNHFLFLILCLFAAPMLHGQSQLKVSQLPDIPDPEGFAGMFAGVSNGTLLCMGGANFPEKMPWEGGEKVWYDHIYVLEDPSGEWKKSDEELPFPVGYGVSV